MIFEGKIKVKTVTPKGDEKIISQHYVIKDEELFANCEYKLMGLCNGDCEVTHITKSKIREIVNDKEEDKPFYKAVITNTFVNDDGTEKETQYPVLICAKNVKEATKLIEDYMSQGLTDMRLDGITKTKIIDVL